jgi:hypothetical protein
MVNEAERSREVEGGEQSGGVSIHRLKTHSTTVNGQRSGKQLGQTLMVNGKRSTVW